jgi:cytochrome c oxidase assembly factor CtaG
LESNKSIKYYQIIAFFCGLWLLIIGSIWAYYISIIFAYPVGIFGFVILRIARKKEPANKWNKYLLYLFILGLVVSIVTLLILVTFN